MSDLLERARAARASVTDATYDGREAYVPATCDGGTGDVIDELIAEIERLRGWLEIVKTWDDRYSTDWVAEQALKGEPLPTKEE